MTTDPMMLLATTRSRELQAAARRDALVRIATCCRPSSVRRAVTAARTRLSAGRTPCCA